MSTYSRIGLAMAGCLTMLLVLGCAQHKAYEAPPVSPTPRADGLVVAGKFRAVVIEDMDNDGNPDVVGGASSPGMAPSAMETVKALYPKRRSFPSMVMCVRWQWRISTRTG
jgi:hypothetical protein